MSSLKITKLEGNGQGSCRRCEQIKGWNRIWTCMLYKIEGYEGAYCSDCVRHIEEKE